jgi:Flp pilus assembly protein TadG
MGRLLTCTSPRRGRQTDRKGTSAVEFAFVAPVFFVLVFGMVEYGRAVMVQQIITNAAREGARVAILSGATTTSVTTAVSTYLTNSGISGATPSVSPDPSTAANGALVTVSVSVPYSSVSWLPSPFWLGSTTLHASCEMRTEN